LETAALLNLEENLKGPQSSSHISHYEARGAYLSWMNIGHQQTIHWKKLVTISIAG
jgi:hypothetical protein